ncbi:hypothetical protein [Streptomyces sp. NBC_01353]|uniref:hypothetical protein n=1 Tax=Streptomyces sp. NBC_01353 TaxID=2903835 RepID=UPI002E351DE6|nr:hypothetical protein [Streptomyces sp. NBC_01353]
MVIPASSLEYLSVTVTASPEGADLTGTAPRFAFLPDANRSNPEPEDWIVGEWDGDTTARVLVGPAGDSTLTRGSWHVWVSIDPSNDEHVVRKAGTLIVT